VTSHVEQFDLLGFGVTLLVGGADAAFSVQRWCAQAGAGGIPVHLHDRTEEGFYVVEGEIGLWLDDRALVKGAGSYVLVGAGRHHTFWNPADRPATYLTVMSPAGFERYLVELAYGLQRAVTDQEAAALRERLSEAYDITVVGPPPRMPGRTD
jgi:mannose-6-phosphate isomerase-like protein (cupin superfamily)